MIRILQIVGGMNRRGAETFIMNVYRQIDRTKVQFDFLVYDDDEQDYEKEITKLGGLVIHRKLKMGILGFLSIPKIKKVIRDYGPYKAIHAQTLFNMCYALIASLAYPDILRISHSHSTKNRVSSNILVKLYQIISRKIIRKYTQVMCACGEEAGEFMFGQQFVKKGIILNNGIDLDLFCKYDETECKIIRKEFGLDDCIVIGSVARFFEVKNHSFMIEIAKVLKSKDVKFKMVFVGDGDLRESIQKKICDNNLQDEVLCIGVRSDIYNFMHVFDAFLMPSYYEGNPVTLVEAQAAGLPSVISDVITDSMDMGLNLIYKIPLKDNPVDWANALINVSSTRMNDDKVIRQKITERGYDSKATAMKLQGIYLSNS